MAVSSEHGETDTRILSFDAGVYVEQDSPGTLDTLLNRARFYAERFNSIQAIMERAETEYRVIASNEEWSEVYGRNSGEYEEDNRQAERSLEEFEKLLEDEIELIEHYASWSDGPKDALHEGLITYAGVHVATVNENHYLDYEDEIDFRNVSELRAFSEGSLMRNPSDYPLQGMVESFDEEKGTIHMVMDTDNLYGLLERFLDGDSLFEMLDDTTIAEEEKDKVRIEHEAYESELPAIYVRNRLNVDSEFGTNHWDNDPRYIH